jgi:hypothetical protein
MNRSTIILFALLTFPAAALAQHGGGASPPPVAPREASQFDFLTGEWALVVRPKVSGLAARIHGAPRLEGTWRAWRAFDGWGIEDELRIVDAGGTTRALTHTMRIYDPTTQHWTSTSLDVTRARFQAASAEWQGGRMQSTSRGTDQEGRPVLTRTRFTDITPTSFRFQQDRSVDDGTTWEDAILTIEARRTASAAAAAGPAGVPAGSRP